MQSELELVRRQLSFLDNLFNCCLDFCVFIIDDVLKANSYTLARIAVGRLIVGFGVGPVAVEVPMYIAELQRWIDTSTWYWEPVALAERSQNQPHLINLLSHQKKEETGIQFMYIAGFGLVKGLRPIIELKHMSITDGRVLRTKSVGSLLMSPTTDDIRLVLAQSAIILVCIALLPRITTSIDLLKKTERATGNTQRI